MEGDRRVILGLPLVWLGVQDRPAPCPRILLEVTEGKDRSKHPGAPEKKKQPGTGVEGSSLAAAEDLVRWG